MIDDALRQSKPSVLAGALGTAPPVIKPSLPTGPKPAPAPAVAPAPVAPAPSAPSLDNMSDADLDLAISRGRTSDNQEIIRLGLDAASIQEGRAGQKLGAEQDKKTLEEKVKKADIDKEFAAKQKDLSEKQQRILDGEHGSFAPTKETAKDIAGIFSLMTLATFGSGTVGKYHGMTALASLTGAMKGYKEGRDDLYKKEMDNYNKSLAEYTKHQENLLKQVELSQKLLSTDKEAAMSAAQAAIAMDTGGIASLKLRQGNYKEAIKILEHNLNTARQAKKDADNLEEKKRQNKINEKLANQRINIQIDNQGKKGELVTGPDGKMYRVVGNKLKEIEGSVPGMNRLAAPGKEANIPDAISYVKKFTGGNVSKTTAPEILIQASALGDAYGLKAEIEKHPDWVGRTGQVKNIFNRTIESLNTGTLAPEDNGQPELIFAKRYAEYLVNYERSLAGGAKGFTVAFQNRFNKLLEQNQFNAAGFGALMDEQIRTITSKASATSPSVNKKNLTEMALDIKTRAEEYDTADAIRVYSSGKSIAAPATAPKGTGTAADPIKLD
jgi:hypothetical protein